MQREREASGSMAGLQACVMITLAWPFPTQGEHNPPCLPHFTQGALFVTLWHEMCAGKARGQGWLEQEAWDFLF